LLFQECFHPGFSISAISNNKLIGIAGFHTPEGSLTGGITYKKLTSQLGLLKSIRAALILSLYTRKPSPSELVMDGIAVNYDARGKGIGGRLLDEVTAYATAKRFDKIRLDVIDSNARARKLYERKGFRAVKTDHFPHLRWLLGFGASTRMELPLSGKVIIPPAI
ncbi:MAG: GNAT family N-acetyltransferase, partial [bacterium]|nr:GNAT family N-acetyltransferase [bacterium]